MDTSKDKYIITSATSFRSTTTSSGGCGGGGSAEWCLDRFSEVQLQLCSSDLQAALADLSQGQLPSAGEEEEGEEVSIRVSAVCRGGKDEEGLTLSAPLKLLQEASGQCVQGGGASGKGGAAIAAIARFRMKSLDMVIFSCRLTSDQLPRCSFLLEVLSAEREDLLCCSRVSSEQLKYDAGRLVLPLLNSQQTAVGTLNVDYIVVHPVRSGPVGLSASDTRSVRWAGREGGHKGMGSSFDFSRPDRIEKDETKTKQGFLGIGHRGMGCSYSLLTSPHADSSLPVENTIESFQQAAKNGMKMVELDVVLTSDLAPVIYHDFEVCMRRTGKFGQESSKPERVRIHELTLEQLRSSHLEHTSVLSHRCDETVSKPQSSCEMLQPQVNHVSGDGISSASMTNADLVSSGGCTNPTAEKDCNVVSRVEETEGGFGSGKQVESVTQSDCQACCNGIFRLRNCDLDERRKVFPTLAEVCQALPEHVGLNVDVKYPVPNTDGEYSFPYLSRNVVADVILQTLYQCAGGRNVVLGCFDPDICTMLGLKQALWPVFFISNTEAYPDETCVDVRCRTLNSAIAFATSQRFAGISAYCDLFLSNHSLVEEVHSKGLILFTWGDKNQVKQNIVLQRQLGVDGVIYDSLPIQNDAGRHF